MQTITTANKQRYEVNWCGISAIGGSLFFDVVGDRDAPEIVAEFDNPENTKRLIYNDGHNDVIYTGYTRLVYFARQSENVVRIELARPAKEEA